MQKKVTLETRLTQKERFWRILGYFGLLSACQAVLSFGFVEPFEVFVGVGGVVILFRLGEFNQKLLLLGDEDVVEELVAVGASC